MWKISRTQPQRKSEHHSGNPTRLQFYSPTPLLPYCIVKPRPPKALSKWKPSAIGKQSLEYFACTVSNVLTTDGWSDRQRKASPHRLCKWKRWQTTGRETRQQFANLYSHMVTPRAAEQIHTNTQAEQIHTNTQAEQIHTNTQAEQIHTNTQAEQIHTNTEAGKGREWTEDVNTIANTWPRHCKEYFHWGFGHVCTALITTYSMAIKYSLYKKSMQRQFFIN